VRRVGFTLDDPYVEQVWAGVIGPSALLALRRLPVLWREREPALVTCVSSASPSAWTRHSHAAGARGAPSNASSASAQWLPSDALGLRTEVAPLSGRQFARVAEWTRQVHDRLFGMHLARLALAHTDRTLGPDQFLDSARVTARLDHLQHRRRAITRGLGLQP
jgi:hypothetical protein